MLELGLSTAACFGAAFANSRFRPGSWYRGLIKPTWTPADRAFPIIWGVLFLCMTISLWIVLTESSLTLSPGLILFAVQLGLNASWSWLFFGLRRPLVALGVIVLLWIAVAGTVLAFANVDIVAASLLVPYLVWVSIATVLNFELWRLNHEGHDSQTEVRS